ncbi:MAG: hypothetical protein RBQ99_05050 [Trichlorobacter sp.]|nr:hypothetical protein [Trichlorobacter sp.]
MYRHLPNIVMATILALLLVFSATNKRQQVQFLAGENSHKNGDFMAAVTGYESTIRMYLPFSNKPEKAAKQLWEMADKAEQAGDTDHALFAYRALHSSWSAVYCLFQPGKDWIKRSELKIAALAGKG